MPERRRKPLREPRCGLCLTCANATPGTLRHHPWMECVAGADPRRALYDCPSFVRVFTRAPHVPGRYCNAGGGSGSTP
jgi:hypothetical protein